MALLDRFESSRSSDVTSKLERHAEQLSALGHPVRLKVLRFVVQAGDEGAPAGARGTSVMDGPDGKPVVLLDRVGEGRVALLLSAATSSVPARM